MRRGGRRVRRLTALAAGVMAASGCTGESTRLALESQRRANEIEEAVFSRQHEALRVLLFREAQRRLEAAGSAEQRAAELSAVWNDRDLIEFWAIQHERAAALRLVGVDAKLYAGQSSVDLLIKQIEARADRAKQALAARAGEALGER
ncbi:MAG: hypothetical protein LC135_08115 [Phycisphaerae bacterium]|nr:hypothetical protein [Phycisphaerae bacterium]MCZ2399819.1 hypothetical protein [Phycisphaerae bacterium]NUQ49305.1 hypothetical protein [Phycisphaerae bacterium]